MKVFYAKNVTENRTNPLSTQRGEYTIQVKYVNNDTPLNYNVVCPKAYIAKIKNDPKVEYITVTHNF